MANALVVDSLPYPWPWHGAFDARRTAVLVVSDGLASPPGMETSTLLCSVVERAAALGVTVCDLPAPGAPTPLPEYRMDIRVERPHLGGFSGTDLDSVLRTRQVTDLMLTGFPFELGADSTMRQANDLGYECLVIADCCTGLAGDTLAGAMSSIQMSGGIFGVVANSAAIFELFRNAHERAAVATRGG